MKKRKYLSTVVAVVVLLALAGVAAAFEMGNVDGLWSTIDTDGATCDGWATGPAGGSTSYDSTDSRDFTSTIGQGSIGGTDWNQVRYGRPAYYYSCPDNQNGYGLQSGFGFDGVNDVVASPAVNQPFILGKFCHFNNPINASNQFQYVDLQTQVAGIACDSGYTINNPTLTFTRRFTLDETPNDPNDNDGNVCPYGDTDPCGDQVSIAGSAVAETFNCTSNANPAIVLQYTVAVQGFIPEASPFNGCTTYNASNVRYAFFSDEGADNCACLWAMITDFNPTAVDLKSFTATAGFKTAQLTWTTTTEVDNLGFNLYRAEQVDGPKAKLNEELIPTLAPPGSSFGADYTYTDTGLSPLATYYYWLEDVDISGNAEMHGPVEAAGVAGGPKGKQPPVKSADGRMSVDAAGAVQTGAADSGGDQVR